MIRESWTRLCFFFRRKPSADVDEELQAHLEHAIEARMAAGMPRAEARRQAMIEFGGLQTAREECHEAQPGAWLDMLWQDLRYTWRTLRRDRSFAVIAVLILALGIGANVIVFSLVDTILLRPLPLAQPSKLLWIAPAQSIGDLSGETYSADAYDDLRAMNTSYTDVTGYFAFSSPDNYKLTAGNQPQPVTGIAVAGNFFRVLGVKPVLGRDFSVQETHTGAPAVALLSHDFWLRRFHGDPGIVGRAVSMNNAPMTIVGVLPASFDFGAVFSPGSKVDMLTPLAMNDIRDEGNTLTLIGRLKPGVTIERARAEAAVLFPQFYGNKKSPTSKGEYGPATPVFLKEHVAGQLRRSLYILWAAVGLILLIVCVNLSNLMLARAAARSKEFALRVALGAGRGRLLRQLLTESAVLSGMGAVLAIGMTFIATAWLAHQGSLALPLLSNLHVDAAALLWTLLVAVSVSLLFGLAPGLKMSRGNLQESLKEGSHGSGGRGNERMLTTLVVTEIALACVLVFGAGLLLRSFLHVLNIDLGFQPSHAAAISLDVDYNAKVDKRSVFYQDVIRRIEALPGVDAAGISDNLPLARNRSWGPPGIKGVNYERHARPSTLVYIISPGYMQALGVHLRGRDFGWQDNTKSEKVVILDEAAANFLFPGQDAVGRMVSMGGADERIIGVVSVIHASGVEGSTGWQVYLPIAQDWGEEGAQLVVRSRLPSEALASAVMRTLRAINPNQPAVEFRPLQQFVDHATSPRRFFTVLVAVFAAFGLVLASLGVYGVISYAVTRQTQEIGIRMALGASRVRVQTGVLTRTLRLACVGIAVGTVVSLVVAKAISSMLFAMQPYDPITFLGTLVVLLCVALVAGYIPARRASQIDPLIALRS